jgi:hypothetical protein
MIYPLWGLALHHMPCEFDNRGLKNLPVVPEPLVQPGGFRFEDSNIAGGFLSLKNTCAFLQGSHNAAAQVF